MRLLLFLPWLPLALGEKLVIPEVEAAVSSQLHKFSSYTSYAGPTGTAKAAAIATAKAEGLSPTPLSLAHVLARQAASTYWYETIAHQGIAAFQSNTSYQVYRNVKSYGAKG